MTERRIEDDLLEALEGKNGFGGDVAEIYVYRLKPLDGGSTSALLYTICRHFERDHKAKIQIQLGKDEFRDLGDWLVNALNDHRWHVRVQKVEEEPEENLPRVTVHDLLTLADHIDLLQTRAGSNMQGHDGVCDHLSEMRDRLVIAVGKLTLIEAQQTKAKK